MKCWLIVLDMLKYWLVLLFLKHYLHPNIENPNTELLEVWMFNLGDSPGID